MFELSGAGTGAPAGPGAGPLGAGEVLPPDPEGPFGAGAAGPMEEVLALAVLFGSVIVE